jgi:hypothetical protein
MITYTLTNAQRRRIVDARDTLLQVGEEADVRSLRMAIGFVDQALQYACPHNPELHALTDIRFGWAVTCHECQATWDVLDSTQLLDLPERTS